MRSPKISIVTPSYNQGEYLEQTIKSVLDQNYPNLEYIIMDGGSTDNSVEIIKKYEKYLTYWQSRPDGGQSAAINEGFKHATGEIYAWLNSDDQYTEKTLHIIGEHFEKNKRSLWVSGHGQMINKRGKVIQSIAPHALNYNRLKNRNINSIPQPSTFWKKEIWHEVHGLNKYLYCVMDLDLWLKFSKKIDGNIIDSVLSKALFHKKMKTFKYRDKSYVEKALVFCIHGDLDLAQKMLERPIRTGFQLNRIFGFITRRKFYRYWREKYEKSKNINSNTFL